MKIKIERKKPRDFVAKDLRTPKYRMRVVLSKKKEYKRANLTELMKQVDE